MASAPDTDGRTLAPYAPGGGPQRYIRFAEDVFGLRLAATQQTILRSLAENQRTLVVSGNGVGKSYAVAAGIGAFLFTNPDSTVNLTSGTYSVLSDTIWKPLKTLHKRAHQAGYPIPHRALENPPRFKTEVDDEWFFKAISPTYPKNLEGRHNDKMLTVIEELDSPDISEEHVDSALSTVTSTQDRAVFVANPPTSEANVVYDLMQRDDWNVIQFSSFDSHNVLVDAGKLDAPKIPGLVSLDKIKEDYETWNNREWPGFETARAERAPESDTRWQRRRLGVIPAQGASANRPFYLADVKQAFQHTPATSTPTPQGLGLDVARKGGDSNVLAGAFGDDLRIIDEWNGQDHTVGESNVRNALGDGWDARFPVDAMGEGSGLADRIDTFYPALERFSNGSNAVQSQTYKSKWAEALACFGDFITDGGSIAHRKLREEALVAARVIEFDEKHYQSRDAEVYTATSKDAVKEQLGRSPDYLDAAIMACWAASDATDPTIDPSNSTTEVPIW